MDLANEIAVAGQRDVLALEEDFEVGGPALTDRGAHLIPDHLDGEVIDPALAQSDDGE